MVMTFEKTKVMDEVYIETGVKFFEIVSGVQEFDLENDDDVKAFKQS